MKKLISIIIAMGMLLGLFGACSPKANKESDNVNTQNEVVEEQRFEINEIISKEGTKFIPDLTTTGVTGNLALSSTSIELYGKSYEFPVKLSTLLDDGWELSVGSFKNEFKPKVKTTLASFSLKNKDGKYISINEAYNDTDKVQKLEDCWITALSFSNLSSKVCETDFAFPGGVVRGITAGDVASVYGDPNNSELFTEYSYNLEKQLTYNNHKDSGLSFTYSFEEDGTISFAKIIGTVE